MFEPNLVDQSHELPDIHWMEVNPTKRSLQLRLLGRIKGKGFRSYPLTVVCLPGRSAWDIDYFLQWDKVERIIGIERETEVVEALRQRYSANPEVELYEGSVSEYLLSAVPQSVDLAYLDYCSAFGLSVIQDIELLLERRVLSEGGRCVVGFFNAREQASHRVAQRRLFEELDSDYPSGEEWDTITPDRRRCVAFNALLHRYRREPLGYRQSGGDGKRVGASAVNSWWRYPSLGGSMLTGSFTIHSYGPRAYSNVSRAPDKWYVRGKYSIQEANLPQSLASLGRSALGRGRDIVGDILRYELLQYYEIHGYSPSFAVLRPDSCGKHRGVWSDFVRGVGLCPYQGATLEDVRGELRRIHKKEGVVQESHLRRAHLAGGGTSASVSRTAVWKVYGHSAKSAYGRLLDEMGIPHDLRTDVTQRLLHDIKKWVAHLESGSLKKASPLYGRMRQRGLHKYEDAAKELHRLEVLLKPPFKET